jgi:hypothetical protein
MPFDHHERARRLLDQETVEGLHRDDRTWLDGHIEQCGECREYAELSRRVVRALDGFAFDLDPAEALRIQNTIRGRIDGLASHPRERKLAFAVPVALVLTIVGSMTVWRSAAWLAARWNLPAPAWQIAIGVFWLLPSLLVDLFLLFPGKFIGNRSGGQGETV